MIRRNFSLVPGGEYSVEVDPRTVTPERLKTLHRLGFNRLSFGVQDFDPAVQKAVHRVQPAEQVFAWFRQRETRVRVMNVDLIYGLPVADTRVLCSDARSGEHLAARPHCVVRIRSPASPLQTPKVSWPLNCQAVQTSLPCCLLRWTPSATEATCTWAWTTSPCLTTHWLWPSARDACTGISRATAPSLTVT